MSTAPSTPPNVKLIATTTVIVVVAIVVFIVFAVVQRSAETATIAAAQRDSVVRDDTRMLDAVSDADVTVVEFLDFECEACAAAYPVVEQLREEFAGEVAFAIRYFPIPAHANSENAAVAVEAAARQGALEQMYTLMYTTQLEWGEQQTSAAALFRDYAEELGLDLEQYDADIVDPAVIDRVRSDFSDGRALGVDSTPTFFVNGEKVELRSFDDLRVAILEARRTATAP